MKARFEIVRTDAPQPWHARFVAPNNRIIWFTEKYLRRKAAVRAVEVICGTQIYTSPFQEHPEIAWAGDLVEIREVDERTTEVRP